MKKISIFTGFLFYVCAFCLNRADLALAKSTEEFMAEYTAPKTIVFQKPPWNYQFDLDVNFSSDGKATPVVTNLRKRYDQAWASLAATAEIARVSRSSDMVKVLIKVEVRGRGRHWSAPVATAGDQSTWKWGETDKDESRHEYEEMVFFPFDKYPELRQIENFTIGDAVEVTTEQTKPPAPVLAPWDLWELVKSSRIDYIMNIEGKVIIEKADGRRLSAEAGMELGKGDKIETGRDSKLDVVLGGIALIEVREETKLVMLSKGEIAKQPGFIDLVKGVLWARGQNSWSREKDSLKIATPNAICGVRGTEFEISYLNGATCVNVTEGKVSLSDRYTAEEIMIVAGDKACLPKSATPGF